MSNVEEGNYFDVRRFFSWQIILSTVISSILVYIAPRFLILTSDLFDIPIAPFVISILFAIVIVNAVITRELLSSYIVGMVAGLALFNPADPTGAMVYPAIGFVTYIFVSMVTAFIASLKGEVTLEIILIGLLSTVILIDLWYKAFLVYAIKESSATYGNNLPSFLVLDQYYYYAIAGLAILTLILSIVFFKKTIQYYDPSKAEKVRILGEALIVLSTVANLVLLTTYTSVKIVDKSAFKTTFLQLLSELLVHIPTTDPEMKIGVVTNIYNTLDLFVVQAIFVFIIFIGYILYLIGKGYGTTGYAKVKHMSIFLIPHLTVAWITLTYSEPVRRFFGDLPTKSIDAINWYAFYPMFLGFALLNTLIAYVILKIYVYFTEK